MKTLAIVSSVAVLTVSLGLAASVDAPYEIGTWQGFRSAAISFTFDDDCANQYAIAVPMFNAAGLKLTLFTVTSPTWLPGGTWSKVQTAASYGHEIASHTVDHVDLSTQTPGQQSTQLLNSQNAINTNIPGQKCVTLAYPYCNAGSETLTARYYIAARCCSGQLVPSTPPDFLNISCFVCGALGSVQTAQNFADLANNASPAKQWCVFLIHGIDSDGGYSPLPSSTLQTVVTYFTNNQNRFWVQTFGNIVRYIRERDATSLAQTASTDSTLTLQVTNNLDISIYSYPITLRRPLPAGWPAAAISQNGIPVSAQFVNVNSTNCVMFDVVPNAGPVVLARTALPPVLSKPGKDTSANFLLRLDGQTGVGYAIYCSTDLVHWSALQTNTLVGTYTNLTFAASNSSQFYRAQWVP